MSPSLHARLLRALVLAALIAGSVMLFEPLKSAVLNWDEISTGPAELLRRLLPPFAATFAALAALAAGLCLMAPQRGPALLVAAYAALYAQGNLLVWPYGSFDGSALDWAAHAGKGVLELLVWLALFSGALLRPAPLARRALTIAALILALQGASLAGHLRENAPFAEKPEPATSASSHATDLSRFSRRSNVIVIVLDAVQSDIFAEAMREPDLAEAMPPGFTFYRNAVSLYVSTQFGLQSILTSRAVPDGEHAVKWRRQEMRRSLPARLASAGFDVKIMTFAYNKLACAESRAHFTCIRNASLIRWDAARRADVSALFGLGLFRLAPHFLKPRVYDAGEWRLPQLYPPEVESERDPAINERTRLDLDIFAKLTKELETADVAPRFRFLHFSGAHVPETIDAACRARARGTPRALAVATTRCVLSQTYALLRALDSAGGYDASVVLIVGDHGHRLLAIEPAQAEPPLPPDVTAAGLRRARPAAAPVLADSQRGVPVFLAKPIGARHPLRVSDRPVSLCDVPASIFDALDLAADFACESVFAEAERRHTPRLHYRYPSYLEQRKRPPDLRHRFRFAKFAVLGHSWRPESWTPLAEASTAF
jgi:hypothetical protein